MGKMSNCATQSESFFSKVISTDPSGISWDNDGGYVSIKVRISRAASVPDSCNGNGKGFVSERKKHVQKDVARPQSLTNALASEHMVSGIKKNRLWLN